MEKLKSKNLLYLKKNLNQMESKNNIVEGNNNELNKAGYIIALVSVFFYTLITGGFSDGIIGAIASFIGGGIIPFLLSFVISLFVKKEKTFGKILGIITPSLLILSYIGQSLNQ